jgi:3-oxoacyl-[acyl-carrier-protein] synthase I
MKPLVLTGAGVCVPIGTRTWQAACSLESKVSSFTRESISGYADLRATVSRLRAIEPECKGLDRLIRLAAPALSEALKTTQGLWPLQRPVHVFMALPEALSDLPAVDAGRFSLELPRALELAPEFLPLTVFGGQANMQSGGAVGGADALLSAYQFMQQHEDVEHVVVGGVDCMVDPDGVLALHQKHWIKVPCNSEGFIPGEGAAFVVLSRQPQEEYFVTVYPPAITSESQPRTLSQDNLTGQGLIDAYFQAASHASMPLDAVHTYWNDVDGSQWRGSELTSLSAALAPYSSLPATQQPSAFTGDLGAAWLAFMLAMLQQMRQGLHHHLIATPPAGHTVMQSVTGLSNRLAAWVACWGYARSVRTTQTQALVQPAGSTSNTSVYSQEINS